MFYYTLLLIYIPTRAHLPFEFLHLITSVWGVLISNYKLLCELFALIDHLSS